ncbi:MAG: VOC family protein [Gemmatimonadales bacterium]
MKTPPALTQLTPVMVVDAVEPCLAFWTERLGFTKENEVPGPDGKLIFASAKAGDIEVMYQTRASVVAEDPALAAEMSGHSITLFITVPDLDAIEHAIAGAPVVKPRHKTFYGSEEIYVKEPGGNTVGFAAFGQ